MFWASGLKTRMPQCSRGTLRDVQAASSLPVSVLSIVLEAACSALPVAVDNIHSSQIFDGVQASYWVTICPSSCLSPGTCPNCGQAGHWGVDCPDLLRQCRLIPQGLYPLDSLWTFWTGQGRLMLPWVLCPQWNQDHHSGTFSDCLGDRYVCRF